MTLVIEVMMLLIIRVVLTSDIAVHGDIMLAKMVLFLVRKSALMMVLIGSRGTG